MADKLGSIVQSLILAVVVFLLLMLVPVSCAGCYFVTVAFTELAQVLSTPIPY